MFGTFYICLALARLCIAAPLVNLDPRENCSINKTLRVTVVLDKPYASLKTNWKEFSGNDQYEGYCIDLLKAIVSICTFTYTIVPVKDGAYGSKVNGTWNGMIGALLSDEADLAVASLTINHARSEVIDFTVPFMNLGIGIMMKKSQKEKPDLFNFLQPFTVNVWICIILAYIIVSITLCILVTVTPYEPKDLDNIAEQLNLANTMWLTVASLLAQGTSYDVRAFSTRALTVTWWFFTFILISSYTANLAAFLTVQRMVTVIDSAESLSQQDEVKYGCVRGGATEAFFRDSLIPVFQTMWMTMSTDPSVFVANTTEGIERVKEGNYAYLLETTSLEYYRERDCDLTQIGGALDAKAYGIGLQKGSPYRLMISQAILHLQESTNSTSLKQKWWKDKTSTGQCSDDGASSASSALGLDNLGGIFVVLAVGLGLAFVIAACERFLPLHRAARAISKLWKHQKKASDTEQEDKKQSFNDVLATVNPSSVSSCAQVNNGIEYS